MKKERSEIEKLIEQNRHLIEDNSRELNLIEKLYGDMNLKDSEIKKLVERTFNDTDNDDILNELRNKN